MKLLDPKNERKALLLHKMLLHRDEQMSTVKILLLFGSYYNNTENS
jgi:hypothetical protein